MIDFGFFREIFQSIGKNKLRTLLSGFTVAFAIMLFAVLFGVANGLQNSFNSEFAGDANNSIFIMSGRTTKAVKGMQVGRRIQFDNELYETLKKEYKNDIEFISGRVYENLTASYKNEKSSYLIRAVNPDHQFIEKTDITKGRYINQLDLKNKAKNIVIGKLVWEDLFNGEDPIGKYIDLSKIKYKVVGLYIDKEEGADSNEERIIYMPISTAQQIYGSHDYIDQINLTFNPSMSGDQAIAFSNKLLKRIKQIFSVAPNDQAAVRIRNQAQALEEVGTFNAVLSILVLIIGFGTLIAGIVGISNIMIFIVKERTKEIGIRKALGAPPVSIERLITFESILITSISGFLGLIAGSIILDSMEETLKEYFIKDPGVSTSLVIGATITLIIAGTIAAYLPAKRASGIKPIVALRDE
ncbi:MAG: ABC transporter permease [Flavobacteriaceae bacterium]|jgi:putative ABC transport system permease protein